MSAKETRRLPEASVIKRCAEEDVAPLAGSDALNSKLFLGLKQDRFEQALRICVNTDDHLQAVDVIGEGASDVIIGKLRPLLEERPQPEPRDIIVVYNFDDPNRPLPLLTKKGKGVRFREMLTRLLELLRKGVPEFMNSETATGRRQAVQEPFQEWMLNECTPKIEEVGRRHRFQLTTSGPDRHIFMPLWSLFCEITGEPLPNDGNTPPSPIDGNTPVSRQDLERMTQQQGLKLNLKQLALLRELEPINRESRDRSIKVDEDLAKIDRELAKEIITQIFTIWKDDIAPDFRSKMLKYSIDSYTIFSGEQRQRAPWEAQDNPFLPWEVNVFIDNSETKGVPIVAARISELSDAVGMIGRGSAVNPFMVSMDHRHLSPGAIHHAAGGFLVISARDVAFIPGLWHFLKSAIKNGEIQIGIGSSFTLRPEAIDARIRVILYGPAWLFYLFEAVDDEFTSLFKIRGEILTKVEDTADQIRAYGAWLDDYTKDAGMNSLHESGKCALIEYARRLAGDNEHLSTDFDRIITILREASAANERITRSHVSEAIKNRAWRSGVLQQRRLEAVKAKTLILPTEGSAVGQIYGLWVSSFSPGQSEIEAFTRSAPSPFDLPREAAAMHAQNFSELYGPMRASPAYGFAARISARASLGKFEVVNIEKEIGMAGKSFQKAGLIVQEYLRGAYGIDEPLAARLTFAFEQSYNGIDGDSASLAQYYALVSALTGLPISRTKAITGSMSQDGLVQPIGGVNEKIEGFFDICRTNGTLSGEHGVLIPHQNVRSLMLRDDVVEAIEQKKFNVWSIEDLDQGVEILFGVSPEQFSEKLASQFKKFAEKAKKLNADQKRE